MDRVLKIVGSFSAYYFHALIGLLGKPRKFFSEMPSDIKIKKPLGFLIFSMLVFSLAHYISEIFIKPFFMRGVYLVNSLGMTLIAAFLGYMAMILILGRQTSFNRLFSVFAFASGAALLASWTPYFIWIAEPWRWWLISLGLVKGCGFKWRQALMVIGSALTLIILFSRSLLPF